jgi:hypothetical protein
MTSVLNRLDIGTGKLHQVSLKMTKTVSPIAYGSHIFSLSRNERKFLKTFENKMLKRKSEIKKAELREFHCCNHKYHVACTEEET